MRGPGLLTTILAALLGPAALLGQTPPSAGKPALTQPAASPDGTMIAFASGGDIWEAPAAGGTAHLLVTDEANEARPLYAPDGKRLAFTSTRGGATNIYWLDLASGAVTRLTWSEASEELDSWSADGKWIYFASGAADPGGTPDIYRVSVEGGTPIEVSREDYLSEFQAAPSPDGGTIALVARGISFSQWWRSGHSHIDESEVWLKPLTGTGPYHKLLPAGAKQAWPMWRPGAASIVYMSDRSGAENLWEVPVAGGEPRMLTRFTDGRLLFPTMAADGKAILFERDMAVWRCDPATGQAAQVPIALRGAPATEGKRHLALTTFTRLAVSPDGQKLAVIAHGEIFAAPAKEGGAAQRITDSIGAEREFAWSPDSRRLLYVSERGLDRRLAEYDIAGERETTLTAGGIATVPVYAPDGKSIAYVKDDRELHVLTLAQPGKPATDRILFTGALATDEDQGPRPAFSPDGHWIAFPMFDRRSFVNVHVVPAAGGTARPVSFLGNGQMGRIAWSSDGKYLLIDTAQRSEDSRIVRIDLLPHVPRYKEDVFRDLFKPKPPGDPSPPPDTTAPAPRPKPLPAAARKGAPPPKPPIPPVEIVWDGLRERVTILPVGLSAELPIIAADGKTLVFRAREKGQDNLYSYNLDELATDTPVAQQISASDRPKGEATLTSDGKTLFYLDGGRIITTPLEKPAPKPVSVSAEMDVDFATEKQIVFDEAWSVLDRDFFDPAYNGRDWKALRTHYQPYVDGARTPDELRRVISLMIGELDASHSGIARPRRGPGSLPQGRVGMLGLRFDRTAYEGGHGLVVDEVVPLGPAAIEGRIVRGERLVSVDGRPIGPHDNLDALLENRVGQRVAIGVARASGSIRKVMLKPVSLTTIGGLAYRSWVDRRRSYVAKLSGDRLGYVHLADMSADSLDQLYLDLDADNQAKDGVVIDIRNNNGGFINGYALDVFTRRNYMTMEPRGLYRFPARQALGQRALGLPTVLLTNESSLSDAEDFTEGYRALGLGKIVGQPTAGWIIYTRSETLIDGSTVRVPGWRIRTGAGEDMEMHPRPVDIRVERPLGETASGKDAQLEAAVLELLGRPVP